MKDALGSSPKASATAEAHGPVTVEIKKYVDENSSEIIEVIKKVVWVEEEE